MHNYYMFGIKFMTLYYFIFTLFLSEVLVQFNYKELFDTNDCVSGVERVCKKDVREGWHGT